MIRSVFCAFGFAFLSANVASAHCQVPCGIYNDDNVLVSMQTDVITLKKASKMITELSADPSKNAQQLVRWTTNKESHAQSLQEKVLNYFLAQRLKLPKEGKDKAAYTKKLELCHAVIVTAMKCKQSNDMAPVEKLEGLIADFTKAFGSKK